MIPISSQPSSPNEQLDFEGVSEGTKRGFNERAKSLSAVLVKIMELAKRPPAMIPGLMDESQVPEEIDDPLVRKYLVLTYNKLVMDDALKILDLPETDLFVYQGNESFTAHEKIKCLALAYMRSVHLGGFHFGIVVEYVKALKNKNIHDLTQACLEKSKKNLEWAVGFSREMMRREHSRYIASARIARQTVKDFPPGNFNFVSDELSKRCLLHAYEAIDRAKMWDFFDTVNQKDLVLGWNFTKEFREKVLDVIDDQDGHSGFSMSYTMRNMVELRKIGWEEFVEKYLDASR